MLILLLATTAQAYECVRSAGSCPQFPVSVLYASYREMWDHIENDFPGDELACAAMMYANYGNGAGYLKYDGESDPKSCQLWTIRDCEDGDEAPEECEEPESISHKDFQAWQEGFPPDGYEEDDEEEVFATTTPPDVMCEDSDVTFGSHGAGSCENLEQHVKNGNIEYAVEKCHMEGPATYCRQTCCCLLGGLECDDCFCEEAEEADRRRLVERLMA